MNEICPDAVATMIAWKKLVTIPGTIAIVPIKQRRLTKARREGWIATRRDAGFAGAHLCDDTDQAENMGKFVEVATAL